LTSPIEDWWPVIEVAITTGYSNASQIHGRGA
jgi:hypothetical protein